MPDDPDDDLPDAEEFEDDIELPDGELDVDDVDDVDVDDEELVDDLAVDLEDVDGVDDDEEDDDEGGTTSAATAKKSDEDGEEDDLDELSPDDVEADLDTILRDRIAAADDDEEEDEDEPVDTDDRGDGNRIQPRRPGEFVCQSCFLLKPHTQLADAKLNYCADCV